jgi:hypothetical protein
METSGGKHTEKLMTLVPLTVFVLFVVIALGGPGPFVTTVGDWVGDFVSAAERWLRNL